MNDIDKFVSKFSGLTEEYRFYNDEVILRYDPKDHIYLLVTPEGLVRQDGVTTICHIVDKSNVLIPWACKMMAQKLQYLVNPVVGDAGQVIVISQEEFAKAINEAKTAHKDKLEDAGEVGHAAHGWIEQHIKNLLNADIDGDIELAEAYEKIDQRAQSCCTAALLWISRHNVRWIHTEKKIYSRDYEYAGTMDGLAHVDSCDNPECCPVPFKDKLSVIDWKTSNYLYIEYILQTAAYKQAYQEEFGTQIEDIWVIRLGKEDGEFQAWHVPPVVQTFGWIAFLDALNLSRSMQDLEDSLQAIKNEKRAAEKEKELAAKLERLKVKCKSADKYKGIRKPRCNSGNPCQTCIKKYNDTHAIPYELIQAGDELAQGILASTQKAIEEANGQT